MTAVRLPKPVNGLPASKEMDDIDPDTQVKLNGVAPDSEKSTRHRKKKKKHRDDRKRKRSLSWSTESSECSNVSKRKKKKKKHRRNKSPPSPRVNPIFLWVKQDNTKIVEVLCEDYDKRNRIKLTKTALGWRAIPRTERLSRQSSDSLVNSQSSHDTKDNYESDESLTTFEHSEGSVCHEIDKTVNQNSVQEVDAENISNTIEEETPQQETSDTNREELTEFSDGEGVHAIDNASSCKDNNTSNEEDKHAKRNKEKQNESEENVDKSNHTNKINESTYNIQQELPNSEELPNVEEADFKSEDIPDNFDDCNFSDSSSIPPENGNDSIIDNVPQHTEVNLKYNTGRVLKTNNREEPTATVPEVDIYEFRDDEEEVQEINKNSYFMSNERAVYELILREQNQCETSLINVEGVKEFDEQQSLSNFRECEDNHQDVEDETPQSNENPPTDGFRNNEADMTEEENVPNEDLVKEDETKNEIVEEDNNNLQDDNSLQDDIAYHEKNETEKDPVNIPELPASTDYQNSVAQEDEEQVENTDNNKEVIPIDTTVKAEPQDNMVPEIPLNETKEGEDCKLVLDKCCEGGAAADEAGLDENHNNEVDNEPVRHNNCLLEENSDFCGEVDECVEKTIGDLIGELEERAMNRAAARMSGNNPESDHAKDEHLHDNDFLGTNCTDLIEELEEMCHGIMNERLKNFDAGSKSDLSDIYNYVPTSVEEDQDEEEVTDNNVNEIKPTICDTNIKDIKTVDNIVDTKADSPINLVMQEKITDDMLKFKSDSTQLKNCELESLDLLWRLPEGTTIHHSKVPPCSEEVRPAHMQSAKGNPLLNIPKPNSYKTYVPEQVEPLNLGKPKPKEEPLKEKTHSHHIPPQVHKTEDTALNNIMHHHQKHVKTDKHANDTSSKLLELLTSEEKVDPLAQLKEVLSDPDLAVPDPLLVPRERLSALIANPAKEIPRLLAQKQEIKYPKFDTDLLVVSLTHLQMMLQTTGKDEDMRLYQQHAQMLQSQLNTGKECSLDPATASMINQMLWLPYLEQLQLARTTNPQELLAMLNNVVAYPPYSQWTQQGYEYAQQQQMLSLWQDMMQKPNLSAPPSLSKSYNDLYKSSSQSSVLPGYGQVRPPNKAPSSQLGSTAGGAASRSVYNNRPADITYSNSRRQSKSSRHHHHHHNTSMNNYVQRQQSWPMSQCNMMTSTNENNHRLVPQTSTASNPYANHSSSTSSRISSHPSLISGTGSSVGGGGISTISTSSSSGILSGSHNVHDVTIVSTASSTTTTSANNLPKLKVRDFGIDPSRRPNNLLKFGEPHFAHHPGGKFHDANHSNLWHPLFSSQEGKSYSSPWQWTTPVTVSGD